MSEKSLISLKEAAKISGYSADYIGQLIRAGKLPGKQVYSNITWMTTLEAIEEYKAKSKSKNIKNGLKEKFLNRKRLLAMEIEIIKMVFQNFKSAIPLIVLTFVCFTGVLYSIFYFSMYENNSSYNSINPEGSQKAEAPNY